MNWFRDFLPVNEAGNISFNDFIERAAGGEHNVWMPILISCCILAIWFICKFIRRLHANYLDDPSCLLDGGMMIGNAVLVVVTNLLIIAYIATYGISSMWFVLPDEDGHWTRAIICGIIYLYALANLLVGLLKTMDDFGAECGGRISCKWGLITLVIGIVALAACTIINPDYLTYVSIALVVCQIIQLGIIFSKSMGNGILTALAACGVYTVCALGLIALAAPFIMLAIVLLIVFFFSSFLVKSSMEDDRKREVIEHPNGQIFDKNTGQEYVRNPDNTISPK